MLPRLCATGVETGFILDHICHGCFACGVATRRVATPANILGMRELTNDALPYRVVAEVHIPSMGLVFCFHTGSKCEGNDNEAEVLHSRKGNGAASLQNLATLFG